VTVTVERSSVGTVAIPSEAIGSDRSFSGGLLVAPLDGHRDAAIWTGFGSHPQTAVLDDGRRVDERVTRIGRATRIVATNAEPVLYEADGCRLPATIESLPGALRLKVEGGRSAYNTQS
jgi:hypothetical protein